ncbi:MAG: hypothetical protein U1E25_13380 [Methylocystis sp.]
MSEFLETEIAEPQSCDAAVDPLASKYCEIGIAAVVAALRIMAKPTAGKRRVDREEDRIEIPTFLRDGDLAA